MTWTGKQISQPSLNEHLPSSCWEFEIEVFNTIIIFLIILGCWIKHKCLCCYIRESSRASRWLVMLQGGVQAAHRWLPALRLCLCSSAGTKRSGHSPKIRLRIFGCQTSFWSWGKQACSVIHNSCIFKRGFTRWLIRCAFLYRVCALFCFPFSFFASFLVRGPLVVLTRISVISETCLRPHLFIPPDFFF